MDMSTMATTAMSTMQATAVGGGGGSGSGGGPITVAAINNLLPSMVAAHANSIGVTGSQAAAAAAAAGAVTAMIVDSDGVDDSGADGGGDVIVPDSVLVNNFMRVDNVKPDESSPTGVGSNVGNNGGGSGGGCVGGGGGVGGVNVGIGQQKKCMHHRVFHCGRMQQQQQQLQQQQPHPPHAHQLNQHQDHDRSNSRSQQPQQQQLQQQQPQQQQQLQQQLSSRSPTLSSTTTTGAVAAATAAAVAASVAAAAAAAAATASNALTTQKPSAPTTPTRGTSNVNGSSTPSSSSPSSSPSSSSSPPPPSSPASTTTPLFPSNMFADGYLSHMNAAVLAERYLLLDQVEGSSLYKCIDVRTQQELVCKIANNPCSNLLTAHFRLDGHQHINHLQKVIQGVKQTYLFFPPSQSDLHSYVRVRKRLRETEARRLFRQMCQTVNACHEQGIVLRDLKLRKFVFADSDRTHLRLESLDDAVVLDNPDEDLLQDRRGCPAYVSPEILKANTTYSGKAADMWSLGVILYTMLVGRYPFNDSEHASLFAKISRGHFLVPECLSSKATCMIRALLRRDPEERITSEDLLHHPWLLVDEAKDLSRSSSSDQCVPELYLDDEDD